MWWINNNPVNTNTTNNNNKLNQNINNMKLNLKALIKTIATLLGVGVVTSFIFYFTTPLFWINTMLITLAIWGVARLYNAFCDDEHNK